ncbi:hypothetical protein [uncultured Endozoicomonas sp.]|uniref:hypothetical protein n=1 Tax=uncultured Endozoicomonas sp. TaxID=432652 RepID=UPI00260C59AC|nr:hypothetical protein [uncultured Endozoicomonas sp.]
MLRVFFAVSFLLFTSLSHGGLFFDDNYLETDDIDIDGNPSCWSGDTSTCWIEHSITIRFKSKCSQRCGGREFTQKYRLGFSDTSLGDNVQDDGPPDLKAYTYGLTPFMYPFSIDTATSNGSTTFNLGVWTSEFIPPGIDYVYTTFTFRLKKEELENRIRNGDTSLNFYVVGEDIESTHFIDTLLVSIPIGIESFVRVSGLEDVTLHQNKLEHVFNACLYSTTGAVTLNFDGNNAPGEEFQLSNTSHCNGGASCIPYKLLVAVPNSDDWFRYRKQNHRAGKRWNADSQHQSCTSGNNLSIKIEVASSELNSIQAGVYSDTMTVTIAPKQ